MQIPMVALKLEYHQKIPAGQAEKESELINTKLNINQTKTIRKPWLFQLQPAPSLLLTGRIDSGGLI